MKKIVTIYFILLSLYSFGQKESFDITTYTISKGWKKVQQKDLVQFTKEDKTKGAYCLITLYKSLDAAGNAKESFDASWNALVKETFAVNEPPSMQDAIQEKDWEVQSGHANFEKDGTTGVALLVTASGSGKMVNVLVLTNSNIYESSITQFLESIDFKKPVLNNDKTNNNNSPIAGLWRDNIAETNGYINGTPQYTAGYYRREYTFFTNGTYTFMYKAWSATIKNILFGYETGTYTINGDKLTITPQKGKTEEWNKPANANTNEWGKLVKSENKKLEKTTYTFEIAKYYEQTSLAMSFDKPTGRESDQLNNAGKRKASYSLSPDAESTITLPPGFKIGGSNNTGNSNTNTSNNTLPVSATAIKSNYAFNTTNFDDGWTATEQTDWVEVTKGNIKVLLHYPKQGTIFPADPAPMTNAAWDILVAPRYSNLRNYKTNYISSYIRGYLATGYAKLNATGKEVFIFFFHKNNGWIEGIAPDKNTFIQEFKFDPETINYNSDDNVANSFDIMAGRNKFAVAAADLNGTGVWTNSFASNTFYTNIYTGNSAGMSTYTSGEDYTFLAGQKFKWSLVAANSYGGQTKFGQGKGEGNWKMNNNWEIWFSNKEGKPKRYSVYFSCIKGARILHLLDADYPGSGIYTTFGKKM